MTNKDTTTVPIADTFLAGLWRENPVLRLLLGMCPTLAVTAAVKPALTMGLSVIFVLTCSNIVVSLMRNFLKPHLRILMFTLTIATFVTIADLFLKAFQPEMSEKEFEKWKKTYAFEYAILNGNDTWFDETIGKDALKSPEKTNLDILSEYCSIRNDVFLYNASFFVKDKDASWKIEGMKIAGKWNSAPYPYPLYYDETFESKVQPNIQKTNPKC